MAKSTNQTETRHGAVPMLFYIVVGVLMFISFTLLVNGLSRWNERDIVAVAYVAMGMGGLAFSIMNISSFQNKIRRMTTLTNRVVSISKCPKCGFELKRNFKEGDYVYGVGEACPNCKEHEPMTITSMFLEKPPTQKVMSRQ